MQDTIGFWTIIVSITIAYLWKSVWSYDTITLSSPVSFQTIGKKWILYNLFLYHLSNSTTLHKKSHWPIDFAFSIFDWVKPWIGLKNQLSNFTISFVYILKKKSSAENVRMCVCVCACVCVCVSCQFFVTR